MTPALFVALALTSAPDRLAARAAAQSSSTTAEAPARSAAEVEDELKGLLGSIDTPIPAARWKALGAAARPSLEALMRDGAQLPTRRAKAVDALSALTQQGDAPMFVSLATDARTPYVVRLSAVRAVGVIVPAADLAQALGPVLDQAGDSRVRSAASQVIAARAPEACPDLAARVAREAPEVRAQFAPVARQCGWAE